MADGDLTPAVSVTSAVAGIAVAKPSVSHDVVPISIVSLTKVQPEFERHYNNSLRRSSLFYSLFNALERQGLRSPSLRVRETSVYCPPFTVR